MSKLRTGRVVCQGGCAAKWSEKESELVKSTDTGIASCRSEPNHLTSLGLLDDIFKMEKIIPSVRGGFKQNA